MSLTTPGFFSLVIAISSAIGFLSFSTTVCVSVCLSGGQKGVTGHPSKNHPGHLQVESGARMLLLSVD